MGRQLARELDSPALVLLYGDVGAGKTTLVKGIVSGLGLAAEEEVTSPSYVFVHACGDGGRLYHVDLYRAEATAELNTLGLEDLLAERAIVVVEWADRLRLAGLNPAARVRLEIVSDEKRRIHIEG